MPTPDLTWEHDYPHRDDLLAIDATCAASEGRRPWPPDTPPEEALRRAQISAAFVIEKLARDFMAGKQFTGVQTHTRGVVVDQARTARVVADAWSQGPRPPDVQAFVDRAVGCLRQGFEHDLVVLEWDRPGYDDVTRSFRRLLSFASDPHHTPVVLTWQPEAPAGPPPLVPPITPPRAPSRANGRSLALCALEFLHTSLNFLAVVAVIVVIVLMLTRRR